MTIRATGYLLALTATIACGVRDGGTRADSRQALRSASSPADTAVPLATAATPTALDQSDFVIAGLTPDLDTAGVNRLLGLPRAIYRAGNPYSLGDTLTTWEYAEFTVDFFGTGALQAVTLTRPGRITARGLGVGDAEEKVRRLYGLPTSVHEDEWTYADPSEASGLHVLVVTVVRGRVWRIFTGWVLD